MTGQGGWPLNVFLTPEQVPYYAGTYFPPEDRQGMPSWTTVLDAVREAWDERADEIRATSDKVAERLRGGAGLEPAAEALDAAVLETAVEGLRRIYDAENGGFGGAPKFPPASTIEFLLARGETRDEPGHAARDGRRRHVRPGRGRLRPLLGRRALDRPPLREDALRQRAPGPRVPARLAGLGRRPAAARGRGDAGLDAHRAARARGRVHVRAGRRLRGRGGAVLRVDARPAARGAGTRGRRDGGRLLRRAPGRQLRGPDDPDPRRAGAGEPGRHPPAALRGPRAARLARAGRQAPDLLERAGHRRPGRGRRGAGAAALPGRRPRRGGLRAARPARRRAAACCAPTRTARPS